MSRPTRGRVVDGRARAHIKALIDEAKQQTADAPAPAQMFFGGMLSGLAAAVEIIDGGTAEGSMETVVQRLSAAIGQAYLDGKLPAQPPTPAAESEQQLSREQLAATIERVRAIKKAPSRSPYNTLANAQDNGWDAALSAVHEALDAEPKPGLQLSREQEIRGVQAQLALDLHQALGWLVLDDADHQGRATWSDWWADLCAAVRARGIAVAQVRRLSEMTIQASVRVHARQQALDTLAALDNVSSPAAVTTGVTDSLRDALNSAYRTMVHDSRDWSLDRRDAWLYAIIVGWACEEDHVCDDICMGDDPFTEQARRHRWTHETAARLRTYRAAIAALGIDGEGLPVDRAETSIVIATPPAGPS